MCLISDVQEFPRSICEAHGRPALEAIETMSGKRVPGQVWRRLRPVTAGGKNGGGMGGGSGGGIGRADDRVAALMDQYRQMLRFLGEKGCLLNSVRPEVGTGGAGRDRGAGVRVLAWLRPFPIRL